MYTHVTQIAVAVALVLPVTKYILLLKDWLNGSKRFLDHVLKVTKSATGFENLEVNKIFTESVPSMRYGNSPNVKPSLVKSFVLGNCNLFRLREAMLFLPLVFIQPAQKLLKHDLTI